MGDPVRCLPKVVHPDVAALKLQHNPPARAGGPEPIGGRQPGGGPGRDPDAAPPWGVRGAGSVAEDDELSRVSQCARRGALCEGRSLAELEPTAPLAGDRAPGYRTTFAEGDGLSSPAAASDRVAARPEDRHDDVEDESRVTNQEPRRVSTKNGLDSDKGSRTYIMTARRMTSGELLKERTGLCITGGYEALRPGSSRFTLTMPGHAHTGTGAWMRSTSAGPRVPDAHRCRAWR